LKYVYLTVCEYRASWHHRNTAISVIFPRAELCLIWRLS